MRTAGRTDPAVYNLEQASIVGLRVLLTQAVEALSFIHLLIDYKLSELVTAWVFVVSALPIFHLQSNESLLLLSQLSSRSC